MKKAVIKAAIKLCEWIVIESNYTITYYIFHETPALVSAKWMVLIEWAVIQYFISSSFSVWLQAAVTAYYSAPALNAD